MLMNQIESVMSRELDACDAQDSISRTILIAYNVVQCALLKLQRSDSSVIKIYLFRFGTDSRKHRCLTKEQYRQQHELELDLYF